MAEAFTIRFTAAADCHLAELETRPDQAGVLKAVRKALAYLGVNPRHPGLRTHEYGALQGAAGEKVWEAYAQNQTPGAYRVFFHDGPGKGVITIVAITPHP